jgi:diguanylate cyclase (GGDEF)-like protein
MQTRRNAEIPDDIYIPFVETLFRDGVTLAIGVVTQALLAGLVFWKTGNPVYLAVVAALLISGGLRLMNIRKYRLKPAPQDRAEAEKREREYIALGSLHAISLGFFCFTAIYLAPNQFGEVAALCTTLASATSIAGRNYGSPRMVIIMIVCATCPITLGFLLRGDVYHVILGLLSGPFFYAIRRFADTVREVLFAAISEEKKAASLAQRFNRALNTMSHGLIMLSPEGNVVVANAEAAQLLSLKSPEALLGRSLKALIMRAAAGKMLTMADCRYVESQLTRALREGRDRKLLVSFSNGRHFEFSAREGRDELGVITFEDVTTRVEAEDKIRHMARYDRLTGLVNRAYFQEIVSDHMASGVRDRLCAIAVMDLDDFKSVNDTLGHPVGDGLIYAVSERLAQFASDEVKVSRFGGDEFMIYFDRIEDEDHLGRLLDELFAALQGEADVAGHSLRIQASGGAVLACVSQADVDGMIVKADLALYKAKELGKNGWRLFESSMDAAFRNKQILKADLRTAIEKRGLRAVYQPIVSLETMRIASCEALCRWDHPELGAISPMVFIPLAEEMGIISDISSFILEAACMECVKWPEDISVSVNLSAKDFRNRDIVQKVRDVLDRSGLEPERLEIEVTETALLDDKASTRHFLEELKAVGVRIALDDFGTGYSSLSYLHTLPLDKVKIDRSFLADVTRNERSLELLRGVVNLSRPLGLVVTIEGVETFDQLRLLSSVVKPDLLQGYLFGSALSASGIETMAKTASPFAKEFGSLRRVAALN